MTRIAELARRTDRLLRDQHPDEAFVRMLRAALHEWSQAVWAAAEALGASEPHGDDLDRASSWRSGRSSYAARPAAARRYCAICSTGTPSLS